MVHLEVVCWPALKTGADKSAAEVSKVLGSFILGIIAREI